MYACVRKSCLLLITLAHILLYDNILTSSVEVFNTVVNNFVDNFYVKNARNTCL